MGISAFNRLIGFAYFLMETAGNTWVSQIRRQALTVRKRSGMIKGRTPVRGWLQTLVKDGEDVRSLVVAVTGEGCVMVWVGLEGDAEGMPIEGWQLFRCLREWLRCRWWW